MAPPTRASGRMGGCETTPPAHTRTRGPSANPRPATTTQPGSSPPGDHRPPLAGVKLVRPRPRPDRRYRCGRSSLTPDQARQRETGSCGESQQTENRKQVPHPARRPTTGHRDKSPCSLDNQFPHGWVGGLYACRRARGNTDRRCNPRAAMPTRAGRVNFTCQEECVRGRRCPGGWCSAASIRERTRLRG